MNYIKAIYSDKLFLIGEFVALLLLFRSYVSNSSNIHPIYALPFGLLYALVVILILNISASQLGITIKNTLVGVRGLLIPTLTTILLILLLFKVFPTLFSISLLQEVKGIGWAMLTSRYLFFSVPMQELIFRGYLISRLEFVTINKLWLIAISSILFMSSHIPFGNIGFVIGSGFLGILYSYHFLRYRNLISIMISHSIVGMIFIYLVCL